MACASRPTWAAWCHDPTTTGDGAIESIREPSIDLLAALGAEVVDFPRRTDCCGGHMTQISPDTGFELIRRLVDSAQRSGALLMATVCPMCQMNVDAYQGEMNRHFGTHYHMPILFFTQLIGLAFGHASTELGLGSEIVSSRAALAQIGVEVPVEAEAQPGQAPGRANQAAEANEGTADAATTRRGAAAMSARQARPTTDGPAQLSNDDGSTALPDETDPSPAMPTDVDPRVGVYVCHCGSNIAGTVDVAEVRDWAAERLAAWGVVVARDYPFMCSSLGQELIQKDIHELGLTRVVVAACSPHMHERTFRGACEQAGLNPYLCELVSIREQVSWVHTDRVAATQKAKAVVAGGTLRVREQEPLEAMRVPIHPATLVVGGGISGISAALEIADAGFPVHLVERQPSIGGHMAQFDKTFPTLDCSACILTPKMVSAGSHPNITLHTWSEVTDISGHVGAFTAKILHRARYVNTELCTGCGICEEKCPARVVDQVFEAGLGERKGIYRPFPQAVPKYPVLDRDNCVFFEKGTCRACEKLCPTKAIDFDQKDEEVTVEVGNIVLATGFTVFDARRVEQYGYGRYPNVFTSLEFERMSNAAGPTAGQIVLRDGVTEPEGRGHHPLRRQPGPQLQRLLLGHLLHAEPEVRAPDPRAHRRRRSTSATSTCGRRARASTSSTSASRTKARTSSAAASPRSPMPCATLRRPTRTAASSSRWRTRWQASSDASPWTWSSCRWASSRSPTRTTSPDSSASPAARTAGSSSGTPSSTRWPR